MNGSVLIQAFSKGGFFYPPSPPYKCIQIPMLHCPNPHPRPFFSFSLTPIACFLIYDSEWERVHDTEASRMCIMKCAWFLLEDLLTCFDPIRSLLTRWLKRLLTLTLNTRDKQRNSLIGWLLANQWRFLACSRVTKESHWWRECGLAWYDSTEFLAVTSSFASPSSTKIVLD